MINPNELVRRPVRERDFIPIATDAQVIEYFQRIIEDIAGDVRSSIRGPHYSHSNPLLHISGEEEYSLIGERNYGRFSLDTLRVERSHAQELLLKVMSAYGFAQDKSHFPIRYNHDDKRYEYRDEIIKRPDGTTRERILYPSQTIKGLEFERVRSFVTETGEATDVWWNVVDTDSMFKLDIPTIFRRKPKPQISP